VGGEYVYSSLIRVKREEGVAWENWEGRSDGKEEIGSGGDEVDATCRIQRGHVGVCSMRSYLGTEMRFLRRKCGQSFSFEYKTKSFPFLLPQPPTETSSICPSPPQMTPRLKATPPFTDTTDSPISSTSGTCAIRWNRVACPRAN